MCFFLFFYRLKKIFSLIFKILLKQLITLSDLECDYLNAQQCCSRLNAVGKMTIKIINEL